MHINVQKFEHDGNTERERRAFRVDRCPLSRPSLRPRPSVSELLQLIWQCPYPLDGFLFVIVWSHTRYQQCAFHLALVCRQHNDSMMGIAAPGWPREGWPPWEGWPQAGTCTYLFHGEIRLSRLFADFVDCAERSRAERLTDAVVSDKPRWRLLLVGSINVCHHLIHRLSLHSTTSADQYWVSSFITVTIAHVYDTELRQWPLAQTAFSQLAPTTMTLTLS